MIDLIADIELPTAPDTTLPLAAVLAISFALVFFAVLLRQRAPKESAIQDIQAAVRMEFERLRATRQEYDGRELAYRLAALLRTRFHLHALDADAPPSECAAAHWKNAVTMLNRMRYCEALDAGRSEPIFEVIANWFVQKPRKAS